MPTPTAIVDHHFHLPRTCPPPYPSPSPANPLPIVTEIVLTTLTLIIPPQPTHSSIPSRPLLLLLTLLPTIHTPAGHDYHDNNNLPAYTLPK